MASSENTLNVRILPLFVAWFGLVSLSLLSLGLGYWLGDAPWAPALVGSIIWLKAWLVARYFLEAPLCRTFIRRLIWTFIAFAPIALVITDMFASDIARMTQL